MNELVAPTPCLADSFGLVVKPLNNPAESSSAGTSMNSRMWPSLSTTIHRFGYGARTGACTLDGFVRSHKLRCAAPELTTT